MRNIITNQLCHPQAVFSLLDGRQNGWETICFERRFAFQFNSIWILNGLLCWGNLILTTLTHRWFLLILSNLNFTLSCFISIPVFFYFFIFILSSISLKLLFCQLYNIIGFIASLSKIRIISNFIKTSWRL